MKYVTDLHLHSKYSRAVSQDMVLETMAEFASKKGLDILSTGDWTHPLWIREIKNKLVEEDGLFVLKSNIKDQKTARKANVRFLLSVEISSIYSQGGKTRRIHNLVFVPSIESAEKINAKLLERGANLSSDGRPIIGLSSKNLLELVLSVDDKALFIPAHAWTPWFSLYGSNSGFDSISECFGDLAKYIYAVETGLSSDPEMNWRIGELDYRSILSFSDAHSPMKMGREATIFATKNGISNVKSQISNITYEDIAKAIKRDPKGRLKIAGTIEFYPEEGKYHYTGHRNCAVSQNPDETARNGKICPVCKRSLTVGVMQRVQDLARDLNVPASQRGEQSSKIKTNEQGVNWVYEKDGSHPPFVKLVPLIEIIAESLGALPASLKVKNAFSQLCEKFGGELNVLLKTEVEDLAKINDKIAEGISKVRKGDIFIKPGFDGEYGKVRIWNDEIQKDKKEPTIAQLGLDF